MSKAMGRARAKVQRHEQWAAQRENGGLTGKSKPYMVQKNARQAAHQAEYTGGIYWRATGHRCFWPAHQAPARNAGTRVAC